MSNENGFPNDPTDPLGDRKWHTYHLAQFSDLARKHPDTVAAAIESGDKERAPQNWIFAGADIGRNDLGIRDLNATSGLHATAFVTTKDNNLKNTIVIAFRGAEDTSPVIDNKIKVSAASLPFVNPAEISDALTDARTVEKSYTNLNDQGASAALKADGDYLASHIGALDPFNIGPQNDTKEQLKSIQKAVAGDWHPQFADALDYVADVKRAYPDYRIEVTGYKEGGSLAQLAAHTYGIDGQAFDPLGAKNIIDSEEYKAYLADRHITPPENTPPSIDNWVVKRGPNDSYGGEQIGNTLQVSPAAGREGVADWVDYGKDFVAHAGGNLRGVGYLGKTGQALDTLGDANSIMQANNLDPTYKDQAELDRLLRAFRESAQTNTPIPTFGQQQHETAPTPQKTLQQTLALDDRAFAYLQAALEPLPQTLDMTNPQHRSLAAYLAPPEPAMIAAAERYLAQANEPATRSAMAAADEKAYAAIARGDFGAALDSYREFGKTPQGQALNDTLKVHPEPRTQAPEPSQPLTLADPQHPQHRWYEMADKALGDQAKHLFPDQRERTVCAIASCAAEGGLKRIDEVYLTQTLPLRWVAEQHLSNGTSFRAATEYEIAKVQPLEKSTDTLVHDVAKQQQEAQEYAMQQSQSRGMRM